MNRAMPDVQTLKTAEGQQTWELIESACGAKNVPEFQQLSCDIQDAVVRKVLDAGASVRQVVSHTGFTTKQIRSRYTK